MNDLISRQAAIDATQGIGRLATLPDNDAVIRMSAVEYVLFNLPSAQPEIIRCKDCRKHNISPKSQEDYCPLYFYRGMSFGDEYDLEFCSYAAEKRK